MHIGAYIVDVLTFYFLLCYRPFGIQFHVETSLFNVFFAKLDRGTVKPVRWGVSDEQLDQVKSFGVKKFEDFTWKHLLDFYSCADCGRCSDNCPANAVGRPLSPRFLTTKARDYAFQHYPMFGSATNGQPLIGGIYSEDEIWSCTTCGACEEECPLLIEYIDKIVDLRRGMVDDGNVPKSIQKALKALESRGNPYGKLEKKKADWTKDKAFQEALLRAESMYTECRKCHHGVCGDCFDSRQDECVDCITKEREGAALADRQSHEAADAAAALTCPNCQCRSAGGRFCNECGFDMASTHKSCPTCGSMAARAARFCGDCGHNF